MSGLTSAFADQFGYHPRVSVRSPGRVNLIGEHTDYSLLPVMPIAIDRSISFAADVDSSGRIEARSMTHDGVLVVEPGDSIQEPAGWHRYLAAAIDAVGADASHTGARILVDADLPSTGGLSSSSAFTVGAIALLNALWDGGLSNDEIRTRAIVAERAVGVESGGMDQTVIALARPGHALRIDFDPFAVRPVAIPESIRVVAAYSGSMAPKGGSARDAYNTRVVACRCAAALLGRRVGRETRTPPVLADVFQRVSLDTIEHLPEQASAAEVAGRLSMPVDPLVQLTAARFDQHEPLPVRAVAHHVLTEAGRVDDAEVALLDEDLPRLGSLLGASHTSLQRFGASTPALDRLTAAMRHAGADGARITGAGFGGYALAVVAPNRVDEVIAASVQATGGPAFEVIPAGGVEVSG